MLARLLRCEHVSGKQPRVAVECSSSLETCRASLSVQFRVFEDW